MTIMVPLGNVAFTFHFMPGHVPLRSTDIGGLFLIMVRKQQTYSKLFYNFDLLVWIILVSISSDTS